MKRNLLPVALIIVCLAAMAFAAQPYAIDAIGRWVKGPLQVGTRGNGLAQHAITQSLATTVARDLGSVDAGCYYGSVPLVGARAGDACFASLTSPWLAGVSPTCYPNTDSVMLVVCGIDPPDAGFSIRVLSSQ